MKKAWAVIALFVVLSPLGILLTWNWGDAWGEWGEVKYKNETWSPKGYSGGAPLSDYDVPGWDSKFMASLGYWISALVGIIMSMLLVLGIAKFIEIWRKEE